MYGHIRKDTTRYEDIQDKKGVISGGQDKGSKTEVVWTCEEEMP